MLDMHLLIDLCFMSFIIQSSYKTEKKFQLHIKHVKDINAYIFVTLSKISPLNFLTRRSVHIVLMRNRMLIFLNFQWIYSKNCKIPHALGETLCVGIKTSCRITQWKTHRKWLNGNENKRRITQWDGLHRCRIRIPIASFACFEVFSSHSRILCIFYTLHSWVVRIF